MPHTLIRWFADDRSVWLKLDAAGRPRGGVQAGLPAAGEGESISVVVPAEDVLLLSAPRVARSERQLAQALPYAIEDQLAVPVETQHVAWAPSADPDRVQVAVIAKSRLDALLSRLRAAGLEPDALLPEPLLLPFAPGRAALLAEPGRVLIRSEETRAVAVTPEELPIFLSASPTDAVLAGGVELDIPAVTTRRVDDALLAYADAHDISQPLNLLQGTYAPRRRDAAQRRGWQRVAALAAGVILIAFAHLAIERQQLAATVEAQQAEMADLLRRAVPGTQRIVDPEQQLRAALAATGEGQGERALALLAAAAPALAADAQLSLDALDYRNEVLELTVTAPDIATLEALRTRLRAADLPVELAAATPGSRGVEGRLRIGGRA